MMSYGLRWIDLMYIYIFFADVSPPASSASKRMVEQVLLLLSSDALERNSLWESLIFKV